MKFPPPSTIGVLGGGQLGRMLALEARRAGHRIAIFTDEPQGCPAGQFADQLGRDRGPVLERDREAVAAGDHVVDDVVVLGVLRDPAGEHVAEVAAGHAHVHRSGEQVARLDVVDDLRHHPCPVDAVDRGQAHPVAERRVVEHRLHQVLAVVEGALDGDVVDVGLVDRGHLLALHIGDPTGGVEHHDVEAGVEFAKASPAPGIGDVTRYVYAEAQG